MLFGSGKGTVGKGDKDNKGDSHSAGAVAYLLGEENKGLAYMFIMMNAARFAVGVQSIGLAHRAYQQAVAYAKDRQQGKSADNPPPQHAHY
ncbi:MAG: acyl-CoA dehydrogenase family protein [Agrobacterium sp.]|nr:acyl-CoA dehydrogenase family protein [Agrobacterium sp.]